MVPDSETNFIYLADCLPNKYPLFYSVFETLLRDCNIPFAFLPGTKDIWAVDYMPIQVAKEAFVQFDYNPDYLRSTERWRKTISDVEKICSALNIPVQKSDIILDGGNVVKAKNKAILCDKVFKENPQYQEKALIKKLEKLLHVEELVFIPTDFYDEFGHADGMVRFLDENTVLINDYSREDLDFQLRFRLSLHNARLAYIEVPYNPYQNQKDIQANGTYINFLQTEQSIVVPTFGLIEDEGVIRQFEELFGLQKVCSLESSEIAKDGGVLNCITWNIHIE